MDRVWSARHDLLGTSDNKEGAGNRQAMSCALPLMGDLGHEFGCAAVFGATGGIGRALVEALAARGVSTIYAGSRGGASPEGEGIVPFRFDYDDPETIAKAADMMRGAPPTLVIVTTGVLTLDDGKGPEKSLKQIEAEVMAQAFRLNTIGPALVAKHMLPLLPRNDRSVFAALSARVGSISDNRLGGWHSYRASKAALNMLIRNYAIELRRTHERASVVGLHPGTVDTKLSEPFQGNVPDSQLFSAERSAGHLLDVIAKLDPNDSGKCFDWKGEEIPA